MPYIHPHHGGREGDLYILPRIKAELRPAELGIAESFNLSSLHFRTSGMDMVVVQMIDVYDAVSVYQSLSQPYRLDADVALNVLIILLL